MQPRLFVGKQPSDMIEAPVKPFRANGRWPPIFVYLRPPVRQHNFASRAAKRLPRPFRVGPFDPLLGDGSAKPTTLAGAVSRCLIAQPDSQLAQRRQSGRQCGAGSCRSGRVNSSD